MSIEISSFLEEFLKKLRVLNCVPAFDCESDVFAAFLVAKFDKIGHIQRATAEGVVLVTRAVVVMEVDMSYPLTHNRDPVLYRHFLCHAVGMAYIQTDFKIFPTHTVYNLGEHMWLIVKNIFNIEYILAIH